MGKMTNAALLPIALIVGVAAGAEAPLALRSLPAGQWRFRDPTGAVRSMCVGDPIMLAQVNQGGAATCRRQVISEQGRSATVAYSCPGVGQGRTTITIESAEQVRIETQGVSGGQPFDASYVGTFAGRCG